MKREILSPAKIHKLALDRFNKNRSRNDLYNNLMGYYFGPTASKDRDIKNMDGKGRPLLRQLGESTTWNYRYFVNKVAPIVEDYQAIIGRVPSVRVDPPDQKEESAQRKAEKQTKYLLSTYELSRMEFQQAHAGWLLPLVGDAAYVLEVDGDTRRVGISCLSPQYCYPSFMKGFMAYDLYDLVVAYREDPDVLKRDYGYEASDNPDSTTLVTYLSPWQRTVLVQEEVLAHVVHDLGFCPAEWVRNKVTATGTPADYGSSEIYHARTLQDFQNWSLSVGADALVQSVYPMLLMVNPTAFTQDQLEIGPNAINIVEEGGDMKAVDTRANPAAAMQMVEQTTHDIYIAAGTTSVRAEGEQHSSIQTGRAMHAAQGPQATRVELKQALMGAALQRLNSKAMMMQEKGPGLNKPFEIYGRINGRDFREDFDPKADIDGWYQNRVTWDEMVGVNKTQRMVMAMQGMAGKVIDDLTAREIAGIEDPMGMRDAIEQFSRWEMGLQAEGQAMQQAAMEPKPGIPNVQFANQPQAGGQTPMQMPMRPPNQQPPQPPGAMAPSASPPTGLTIDVAHALLMPISARLRGTVWAVGQLAATGLSLTPEINISNYKDYEPVLTSLRKVAPQVKVLAKSEEAMPPEKVQLA